MLHLLLGRAKTGKTTRLYQAMRENGKHRPQVLIVPEQYSHEAERRLCQELGGGASAWAEVLSFTRLYHRVLTETGGLAQPMLDGGGQLLLMHQAVHAVSSQLTLYAKPSQKAAFLERLLATRGELKSYCIQPQQLIEAGDNVRLKGQVSAGTVMEVQGKQAVVAFGMIKSTVKLEQLEKVSKGQIKKEIQKSTFVSVQTADDMHEKKLNFKQEIDVRGMRGDEALQAVTYFVDDAIQVGAARIRILHGTGTGILRQLIRDYLHTVPGVRQYHDEHVQFGGAGITVVELE